MKAYLFSISVIVSLLLTGCNDDTKDNAKGVKVRGRAMCSTTNSTSEGKPDTGSLVYVFYGKIYMNTEAEYKGKGKYYISSKSETVSANQVEVIGSDSYVEFYVPNGEQSYSFVIESAHYTGKYVEQYLTKEDFAGDVPFILAWFFNKD